MAAGEVEMVAVREVEMVAAGEVEMLTWMVPLAQAALLQVMESVQIVKHLQVAGWD